MVIAIVLGLVGLALIYFEFFLPGGFMAIGGGALLVASMVVFALKYPSILIGLVYFAVLIVLLILVCKLAIWRIKTAKPEHSVYLEKTQEGYLASSFDKELIGKGALCLSDLKPSGHILVDGKQYQAVSESGYLHKGDEVLIIKGEGGHYIVKLKN